MIGCWMDSLVCGGVLLISGKFWTLLLLSNSAIYLKEFSIASPLNIVGILLFSVLKYIHNICHCLFNHINVCVHRDMSLIWNNLYCV